jgi:hypothetical protein
MNPAYADNLERELRFGLQALTLPAEAQAAYHAGACPTCELWSDFVYSYEALAPAESPRFSGEQRDALSAVYTALQTVPESERVCWDNAALAGDSWARLRGLATAALAALRWPVEPPTAYRQVSPRVWQRP